MPIVVDHSGSSPELDAALALLLAQAPPPDQAAPPNPLDDLNAQVAAINSGAPSAPQPAAIPGPGSPPNYRIRSAAEQPHYAQYGVNDSGIVVGGGRGGYSSRLANQDLLAQFRANQQMQRQEDRQAEQAQMESMQAAEQMSRQQAHDPPLWIQQGVASGSLRYSPAQLRERQQLQDSIDRVNADPSWSPAQRAIFESRQRERIRSIDLAPQSVPVNERPLTPQQQADQMTWTEKDPVTGQDVEWQMESRAGTVKKVPTARGQAIIDNWLDEQKHNRAAQLKQMELDAKAKAEAQKPAQLTPDQRAAQAIRRIDIHARLSDLNNRIAIAEQTVRQADEELRTLPKDAAAPTQNEDGTVSTTEPTAAETADLKAAFDKKGRAQKEVYDLERQRDQYLKQAQDMEAQIYRDQHTVNTGAPPTATDAEAAAGGFGTLIDTGGAPIQSNGPVSVSSPEELQRMIADNQLVEGDTVMTPQGPKPLTADVIRKLMGGQ